MILHVMLNNKINRYQHGNLFSVRSLLNDDNELNNHKYTDSEIAFLDDYYNRINKSHGVSWDTFTKALTNIKWDHKDLGPNIQGEYNSNDKTITTKIIKDAYQFRRKYYSL